MSLQCGIVGLPNVGKSTLFNCLSNAKAQAANFPFCTIEPNVGVITVPDERLAKLVEIEKPASVVPANRARRGIASAQDDKLEFSTTEGIEPILSFDQMGIKDDLLRGIYGYGFEKPSAIQQRAVRPIIEGRDVIAQAQSGTGKTSMIALTVCQLVDTSSREYASLEIL